MATKKAAPKMPMHDMGGGKMMPGKKHMMPDMPPKGMGPGMMGKDMPKKGMSKKGK